MNLGYIQAALTETRRVLNELVLEPLKEEQYYEVGIAKYFFCILVSSESSLLTADSCWV